MRVLDDQRALEPRREAGKVLNELSAVIDKAEKALSGRISGTGEAPNPGYPSHQMA
jgi:hypothetical protein